MSQNQEMPGVTALQEASPYEPDASPPHVEATSQPADNGPHSDPKGQRRAAAERSLANPVTSRAGLDIIAARYPDLIPAAATHPALKPPRSQQLFVIGFPLVFVGAFLMEAFQEGLPVLGTLGMLMIPVGSIMLMVAIVRLAGNVDAATEAINRMAFKNQ